MMAMKIILLLNLQTACYNNFSLSGLTNNSSCEPSDRPEAEVGEAAAYHQEVVL